MCVPIVEVTPYPIELPGRSELIDTHKKGIRSPPRSPGSVPVPLTPLIYGVFAPAQGARARACAAGRGEFFDFFEDASRARPDAPPLCFWDLRKFNKFNAKTGKFGKFGMEYGERDIASSPEEN